MLDLAQRWVAGFRLIQWLESLSFRTWLYLSSLVFNGTITTLVIVGLLVHPAILFVFGCAFSYCYLRYWAFPWLERLRLEARQDGYAEGYAAALVDAITVATTASHPDTPESGPVALDHH